MGATSFIMGNLAGITLGSLVIILAAVLRSKPDGKLLAAGLVLMLGVTIIAFENVLPPPYNYSSAFGAAALVGGLWPFALLLFGSSASRAVLLAPLVVMMTLSVLAPFSPFPGVVMALHRTGMIGTSIAVVSVVLRSEEDDLDPARRRIRRPFVALIGFWTAASSVLAVMGKVGLRPVWLEPFDELGTALIALLGAILFTVPRTSLLAAPRAKPEPPRHAAEDDGLLARLNHLMTEDQVWREEGLTVGGLAEKLGVPEHRLRPLINRRLGYRNFATFVNEHRLEEVKRRLRSPDHEKETVASIAYACGFGSLGPFGRAFKEATGMTPTAYRQAKLSGSES